jgi:arsenate reductase (thioredoxin)
MREIGIDISRQQSKHVKEFLNVPVSAVVTICDDARASCPKLHIGCKYLHWTFQDPITITGSRRERLAMSRLLRDEIAGRIEQEFGAVPISSGLDGQVSLGRAPA